MWWLKRQIVFVLTLGALEVFALSDPDRIPLHAGPDANSSIRTLLIISLPYEVERVEGAWTKVYQGDTSGWIRTEDLPLKMQPESLADENSPIPLDLRATLDRSGGFSKSEGLTGLLQFAAGNWELKKKMRDPFFRDRIVSVSSEWGPFYTVRTRYYYVKGICLKRMFRDQLRLALAKRRMSYSEMFGSLWSDDFVRVVVESNRGLLGDERLFGKGREYFLELSFWF